MTVEGPGLVARPRSLFIGDMPPCHTVPFIRPGTSVAHDSGRSHAAPAEESCDYCGSVELEWRKCKLICKNCQQINKSCADL